MARNVFRPGEVMYNQSKIHLAPPESFAPVVEIAELDEEEYSGPTADQLRREAEAFQQQWEAEKARMIENARADAERIIKDAEGRAFEEVKRKSAQAQVTKQEAEDEARRVRQEAVAESERIIAEAEQKAKQIEADAHKRGWEAGEEKGYRDGQQEANRLIDRLHVILSKTIERRNEIIEESETQIVQLVLQISQKVVKVISDNQKNVVMNNVIQALRKLRSKSDVVIRVNLQDVGIVGDRAQELMESLEKVGKVTVMEDATVDPGGAVIETDFGLIDARISSQLREIEERILELVPMKLKAKPK